MLEGEARGEDAAFLLWALAQFHPSIPEGAAVRLAAAVAADDDTDDASSLAGALWALAVCRATHEPIAAELCERLTELLPTEADLEALTPTDFRGLLHAHLLARHARAPLALPPAVLDAAVDPWLRALPETDDTQSGRLRRLLEVLEVPHSVQEPAAAGVLRVPMRVDRGEKDLPPLAVLLSSTAVYLRGPGVSSDEDRLTGVALAEDALLAAEGYDVARLRSVPMHGLPHFQFMKAITKGLRPFMVRPPRELMNAAPAKMTVARAVEDNARKGGATKRRTRYLPGARELVQRYSEMGSDDDGEDDNGRLPLSEHKARKRKQRAEQDALPRSLELDSDGGSGGSEFERAKARFYGDSDDAKLVCIERPGESGSESETDQAFATAAEPERKHSGGWGQHKPEQAERAWSAPAQDDGHDDASWDGADDDSWDGADDDSWHGGVEPQREAAVEVNAGVAAALEDAAQRSRRMLEKSPEEAAWEGAMGAKESSSRRKSKQSAEQAPAATRSVRRRRPPRLHHAGEGGQAAALPPGMRVVKKPAADAPDT